MDPTIKLSGGERKCCTVVQHISNSKIHYGAALSSRNIAICTTCSTMWPMVQRRPCDHCCSLGHGTFSAKLHNTIIIQTLQNKTFLEQCNFKIKLGQHFMSQLLLLII